jgi:hypothetical protein
MSAVSYDGRGNLFVGGDSDYGGKYFRLAELSRGSSNLTNISMNEQIGGNTSDYSVQWDGRCVAVTEFETRSAALPVYRVKISGSQGTVVDTIKLLKTPRNHFSGGFSWIQGHTIILPDYGGNALGFWAYPRGGRAQKNFKDQGNAFVAETVSLGQ